MIPIICLCLPFLICWLFNDGAPPGIPRFGPAGVIGYTITAIRYTFQGQRVLDEGDKKFGGRPFAVPTLSGWLIILNAEHVETLRMSDDTVFNQPIQMNETQQFDYTLHPKGQRSQFHIEVVRNEVTRGIVAFIPEVVEETIFAMAELFKVPPGSDYASIQLLPSTTQMVARVTNRVILGQDFCRDTGFINAVVRFSRTHVAYAQILRCLPCFLRRLLYITLSLIWGGSKQPGELIEPYIAKRLEERAVSQDHPLNITEFLLNEAPPDLDMDVTDVAMRVLRMNIVSTGSMAIFLSQALLEMSQMSTEDLESIRSEIKHVLEQEGGWNKASLNKFRKLDSILRETARVHGLALISMNRRATKNGRLVDGTRVPAGYEIAINLKHIHFNPNVYPDPYVFDPFRFSKLRGDEGLGAKHAFTTIDSHFLSFGAGRHACPGRFFVSMELKIMLAHILLNYEFLLPNDQTERPRDLIVGGLVMPPLKQHLLIRPRCSKAY